MNLLIKFPTDEEVIAEKAARFRALSPEERMRSIRGMLAAGALVTRRSPKADFMRDYGHEHKELERRAIREFIARHSG